VDSSSHSLARTVKFTSAMSFTTVWLIFTPIRPRRACSSISFATQQLRIVKEVTQEPSQLPHCLLSAIKAAHQSASGERLRFEDGEVKQEKRLLRLSAVLHAIDPDEIYAVRNFTLRSTSHATTS